MRCLTQAERQLLLVHDCGERRPRPEDGAVLLQFRDVAKGNQNLRRHLPALHVRQQVGAARDQHRVGALAGENARGLLHRRRRAMLEPGKAHHAAGTLSLGFSAPFLALPSPPSHGGATSTGWGYGTAGNAVGPTRASLPAAFSSRAFRTLSGVIGISSMRTPTASWIAFATAGITGRSGPCPTSFAPNGQFGSGSSTSVVSTSGMSSEVRLLYSRSDGILCTSACESFGGRRRNTCSSISASESPMYTLPSTWPRASTGLIVRPMSWAIQIFGTVIQPVAGSTSASTTQAVYEYAGEGPTPAPLKRPGARGGR